MYGRCVLYFDFTKELPKAIQAVQNHSLT